MSRPLRIEYPDAWYHVMNRGRRREDIFKEDGDHRLFLDVLKETVKMWNLKVSAYCLMSNHYHLLVQTPQGNLSRCLRHINGVYTQRFNRKYGLDGSLFRGRYKAVLVEEESYLLELLRYIHRNPLAAGMVSELSLYAWSSHRDYLNHEKGQEWLHRDVLLEMFSGDSRKAHEDYLAFMNQQDSDKLQHFFSRKNLPSILGSAEFIENIRSRFISVHKHKNKEVARSTVLSVNVETVIRVVCDVCQITEDELFQSRRGIANTYRDLAIYILRKHTSKTLAEIGLVFKIEYYSTVSTAIDRARNALATKAELRHKINDIETKLKVS